jgi:hypothetical protein
MHRWDNVIKVDLKGISCEGVDWIHLAQDRDKVRNLANTVIHLQAFTIGGKFLDKLNDC